LIKREFTIAGAYRTDRRGPLRWIASRVLHYPQLVASWIVFAAGFQALSAVLPVLVGAAFAEVLRPDPSRAHLLLIALGMLAVALSAGASDIIARFSAEVLAQRLERDARDELYVSLLGKSQTFHNRQRVGDIMARASNDVRQLNLLMTPGLDLIVDSSFGLLVPIVFIAVLKPVLLVAPLLFVGLHVIAVWSYTRQLSPVSARMRAQFGTLNAGLAETITGIEVVKATAQEAQEKRKFLRNAQAYRDSFVLNGRIQARYLPPLILTVALVGAFLHGLFLVTHSQLTIAQLVTYMGLMGLMRFPAFISIFSFNLVQLGIAGANRILAIMREETELDENQRGYRGRMRGEIVFDDVSFSYGDTPVLQHISFQVQPGQTLALVGQTGAGKSTLTHLVNRTYDVTSGRILLDGADVRDWSLDALRSQISTIEQDIVLFSRTIAENIGFSQGQRAERAAIEEAAWAAQAHEFITSFRDGYETIIGERGVTLSGGQRQRVAIARALLTDPRILILDDSTSAIDSATEDEIQRAIRRVLEGRTTLLITHRIAQIRHADVILVLSHGELVDQGTHEELLRRCDLYRRIFAPYGIALPEKTQLR
jgi:ATP-binding cassette subfamily B protein